jgi:CheY-like chemotaxis protein/two-component sensor histidine kinase
MKNNRLDELNEIKNQFLSNMSHELKTPLNAIIGLTQLLLINNPNNNQLGYLYSLKSSADNLLYLINSILEYTNIEFGNVTTENVNFDLKHEINKLEDQFKQESEEKNLRFTVYFNNIVERHLSGDVSKLNHILFNLISNAFKFTESGFVELYIYNSTVQNNIIFEIKDSGIGISNENFDFIFEKFTQIYSDNTRKYEGVGLGLAITKRLVELLGGSIQIQSSVGLGSSFIVELPFEYVPKINNTNAITEISFQNFEGKKILIVEDNRLNQMVTKHFLKQWNIDCEIAENGQIAIDLLNAGGAFNLVLMDLQMPIMDGFETTQYIRNNFNGKFEHLPIIALTTSTSDATNTKARQSGMNDFVPKPFVCDDLYKVILKYMI